MIDLVKKDNDQLLTVIIPCYNAEKYLDRCLSSLEKINPEDISLLFVNDGSTDSTQEILEKWIVDHVNARIISKENGGYATAINEGLDFCRTEYVMFMGVDDELVLDGIVSVCQQLREKQPDILFFSTQKFYDDADGTDTQTEIDAITKYDNPGFYNSEAYTLYSKIGRDTYIFYYRDTSRCFKMSLLEGLRYFGKTGVSADGCFSSLAACRAQSFALVNEIGYRWHVHRDSVSGRPKTLEKFIEEADVWELFFKHIQKNVASIPDPIINHYFSYRKLIRILRDEDQVSIACKHKKSLKTFSVWAIKNSVLSNKARLKLLFPRLFECVNNIRNLKYR